MKDEVTKASVVPGAWADYYERAENVLVPLWERHIWPKIKASDFSTTLDFACGAGRNTELLQKYADKVYAVDVSPTAIDILKKRFKNAESVVIIHNDGETLKEIDDESISFCYSFDSVVHFNCDLLEKYLIEMHRVMKHGATGFIHHSNIGEGSFSVNPAMRGDVDAKKFKSICSKVGLDCFHQTIIDWGEHKKLDCLSQFRKE
jgi:ubiquinone/menaquinone biosynthesis C-methylase UbiE